LDVEVTRARGRDSGTVLAAGAMGGNITAGNTLTLRQTVPVVTASAVQPTVLAGAADTAVVNLRVAADSAGDVTITRIGIVPTMTAVVSGGGGIRVVEGGVERGRVLHLGSVDANIPSLAVGTHTTIPLATAAEAERYQVGQRITVAGTNITTVTTVITGIVGANLTVSPGVVVTTAASAAESITPAGYTSAPVAPYFIPVTGLVIPAGGFRDLVVRADTTGLVGADARYTAVVPVAQFVWLDGATGANLAVAITDGALVRELPITGPTLRP
jgi:hypothetical protein